MLMQVCVYFALTLAIPTTSRSLIIRTARRTTIIRERLKIEGVILALGISPDYRRKRKSVKRVIVYLRSGECRGANVVVTEGPLFFAEAFFPEAISFFASLTHFIRHSQQLTTHHASDIVAPNMNLASCFATTATTTTTPRFLRGSVVREQK